MKIFNKLRDTKGFVSLWADLLRLRDMNIKTIEEKVKVLSFFKQYRSEATRAAFGVSRRTIFRWQRALHDGGGRLESLNPKSTAPMAKRKRLVRDEVANIIISQRSLHQRIGKEKLRAILKSQGYLMSVSTVGRILSDFKAAGKLTNPKKTSFYAQSGKFHERTQIRRRKLRRPKNYPCFQADTVVRFIDGVKRYILTSAHTENKFAFAGAYMNHSSRSAVDFLQKCQSVSPTPVSHLQTDNGSEFAKEFEDACRSSNITHFHTYPRNPKMNAVVERFNRTLDEDFIQPNRALLRDDVQAFNEKLTDWLIWYNTERPHHSLGQIPPVSYILQTLTPRECHMWWTHTCV